MKMAHRWKHWPLAIVLGMAVATGSVDAAVSCHKINAKGSGQDLGNGATRASIIGGGLLQGTTAGQFSITGFNPPVASIQGTVTFTTNQGMAVVTVAGVFDTSTGEFNASGPVTSGAGKLSGASGNLALHGVEDLTTGAFVEDVSGLLCVDLSP